MNSMKCPKCGNELRKDLSFCPKCGTLVPDVKKTVKSSSVKSADGNVAKKKKPLWLIIVAVLFFPISITYIVVRSKRIKTPIKAAIIIVLWLFVIMVGNMESAKNSSGNAEMPNNTSSANSEAAVTEADTSSEVDETTESEGDEDLEGYQVIDKFIEKYNAIATTTMNDAVVIDIFDKAAGYYRTEYRTLTNAVAKRCTVGDAVIDIVCTDEIFLGYNIRIYLMTDSVELAEEVFEPIVRNVYPEIDDEKMTKAKEDLHKDTPSSVDDIVFYYLPSRGEMFMNNVMYAD